MDNRVIKTIDLESTDLSLHVDLCQQRYLQLINKFDQVDVRLDELTATLKELTEKLSGHQAQNYKLYLGWAGFIITLLAGVIVHLLTR